MQQTLIKTVHFSLNYFPAQAVHSSVLAQAPNCNYYCSPSSCLVLTLLGYAPKSYQ